MENIFILGQGANETIKIGARLFISEVDSSDNSEIRFPDLIPPEVLTKLTRGNNSDVWIIGVIAYFLLSGYVPFKRVEYILNAKYSFLKRDWKDISEEAKDFIQRVLVVKPEERISFQEALEHPWITVKSMSLNIYQRLSQYELKDKEKHH